MFSFKLCHPELRKIYVANDIAVMNVYGFDIRYMSEAECVVELIEDVSEVV